MELVLGVVLIQLLRVVMVLIQYFQRLLLMGVGLVLLVIKQLH